MNAIKISQNEMMQDLGCWASQGEPPAAAVRQCSKLTPGLDCHNIICRHLGNQQQLHVHVPQYIQNKTHTNSSKNGFILRAVIIM